jgi:2-oxoglutarate dehydrogenase E1 component
LRQALARYPHADEFVWVQEESMNMGGWTFMEPRLRAMGWTAKYIGRDSSASPATGSRKVHVREQRELVDAAIVGEAPHLVRGLPADVAKTEPAGNRSPEGREVEPEPKLPEVGVPSSR